MLWINRNLYLLPKGGSFSNNYSLLVIRETPILTTEITQEQKKRMEKYQLFFLVKYGGCKSLKLNEGKLSKIHLKFEPLSFIGNSSSSK